LERFLDDVGIIPNLNINAENLPYIVSEIRYTCARSSLHMYAESCMCMLILACA